MGTTWASWRRARVPFTSGRLTVAGYDVGDHGGAPVTFCHGYPSASVDIAPVLDRLGTGVRLLALDLPGFGASDKPLGHPYSIAAASDAVEALWAVCGVTSTVLAVHDYSVSVGQELLARRAEGGLAVELTGVVWMNGGIYPDLHRPTVGQQLLLSDDGAALAAAMDEAMFTDGIRGTWGERVPFDEGAVAAIWASMEESDGARQMHALLHYIAERREHADRWSAALEGSDLPTVFVWGDLDPVSGAHMIARVEERRVRARIERLADVGHWPTLEAPDEVAAALVSLL
ncbi:MAG TPA: alpha/beta hydrolase [Acidimicrobiales bacterium]|nr:alpha/beta hydrolase [Acidimicrobiales bacterium]